MKMVDDKIQILKHADQWKQSEHPEIMALKLELQKQKQDSNNLVHHLVAHVSKLSNIQHNLHHGNNNNNNNHNGKKHHISGQPPTSNQNNYPPWIIESP
jgi:hypothetical protein